MGEAVTRGPGQRAARATVVLVALTAALTACGREVDVPNVQGQTADNAIRTLEEVGVLVEFDGVERDDDHLGQWTIDSQTPSAGPLAPDETVTLRVASVFEDAAEACSAGSLGDGGRSLSLDMEGEDAGSGDLAIDDIFCVLSDLDVPDSVIDKMQSTTSLDGRVEDDWNGIEASWKYHPDNGLDVLLELG